MARSRGLGDVYKRQIHYSETVQNLKKVMTSTVIFLDNYSRQIIILLSQGVQTKNLPEYLNLSQSAVDKRKAIIKEYFNIEKGNDEDILREARKQGLI
jgi:two-component system response regulator NreC